MEEVEAILKAVLDTEDDAITIINQDKKVLYWNDAAVKTFEIQREQILNETITDFFKEADLMVLQVLQTKKQVKNSYHRPREDKHVVINTTPIFDSSDELIGAVSVERDITHIVKLNDNLKDTSQQLTELRNQVRQSNESSPFYNLKGNSEVLLETIQIARKAARTNATTLILGESGTGKEEFARAIHEASTRHDQAFIPVNCGAIPPALFESEFFGYEAGSFTGAAKEGKPGKLEMAHGGTIFLDEIGELPLDMQVKLLRVLQENRLYRIGDATGREIDVRIIAATNQDLEKMMVEKQFRSDLYYRLNVIQLTIPPLRERVEDIPELTEKFLEQFALKYQAPVPSVEQKAMRHLIAYDWPGNIRELKNIMERFIILCEQPIIREEDVLRFLPRSKKNQIEERPSPSSFTHEKQNMEKIGIEEMLQQTNGNKSEAARRLGISRVTLYSKLKKYDIN